MLNELIIAGIISRMEHIWSKTQRYLYSIEVKQGTRSSVDKNNISLRDTEYRGVRARVRNISHGLFHICTIRLS